MAVGGSRWYEWLAPPHFPIGYFRVRVSGVLTLTVTLTMVAPGYGYGIVAMAALGYGGPQSVRPRLLGPKSPNGIPGKPRRGSPKAGDAC